MRRQKTAFYKRSVFQELLKQEGFNDEIFILVRKKIIRRVASR